MSYKIIGKIGQGSYGSVYLVKNDKHEEFAMKTINIFRIKKKQKESIMNEVVFSLLNQCQYIIKTSDIIFSSRTISLISEYALFHDLNILIKKHVYKKKKISMFYITRWIYQISMALVYLHSMNIIHRDVKSSNVFLYSDRNVKLGDLGIIRQIHSQPFTKTYIGTPYYMSPQIHSNKHYTEKIDIWSLGCVLYELLYLKLPFDGKNMNELAFNIKNKNIQVNNSDRLYQLIPCMLEKDEHTRISSYELVTHVCFKEIHKSIPVTNSINLKQYEKKSFHMFLHELKSISSAIPKLPKIDEKPIIVPKKPLQLPKIDEKPIIVPKKPLQLPTRVIQEKVKPLIKYEYNKIFKSQICF